ncbi:MAG: NAD(P)-dependent oxidoreductase [Parcubacteria group bacterium]|jgi:lactate dehydrogenase-like 2-hydroxyacid dehydrogenase
MINKFKKVVILDTVIFYPEHEILLKELVDNPKIERVPLQFNQDNREWELPKDYALPEDANIIIWPSSLPESFNGISPAVHEKLKTGNCWTEAGLRDDINAQNLYNRIKDADCIITCWTGIPDLILKRINPRAIITWTHEYEHRLNVKMANEKGIYTGCVEDYGTDSVTELEFSMIMELIKRNKETHKKAETDKDIAIGSLLRLFEYYRKAHINERNTRKGKFSHQFHKIGRSLSHYGDMSGKYLDDIIPPKSIEGKNIGILSTSDKFDYITNILRDGFKANVAILHDTNSNVANFYKLLALNEFIIFDSNSLDMATINKIQEIKKEKCIDIQKLSHYDENLKNKTLGVIGLGRIGGRVAEIAKSFGMKIMYTGNKKEGVKYKHAELDELLQKSDIISLNVKAHRALNMLSQEKLSLMKKGSYLINTSDGNALDQEELTRKMLSNELFVGLDVYQGLPTTKTLCLDKNINGKIQKQLANHVLTYRAGWATQESIKVKTYKLLGHMIEVLSK